MFELVHYLGNYETLTARIFLPKCSVSRFSAGERSSGDKIASINTAVLDRKSIA